MDFDLEAIEAFNDAADAIGLPDEWVACSHCGMQSWRLPPHGKESCPLVLQMAEQIGLRFDAERMQAIRVGLSIEEQTRAMREFLDRQGEE